MKFIYTILFIALFCSCEKESAKILPSEYLNKNQIEAFKYDIIRYSDKLPKRQQTKQNLIQSLIPFIN